MDKERRILNKIAEIKDYCRYNDEGDELEGYIGDKCYVHITCRKDDAFRFYIIVKESNGARAYDGYAPVFISTFDAAIREAVIGSMIYIAD